MWILPRQLHTSPFVPDTEALISDLNEQSQACAQSLLARSKASPARTWSQRWKRDSWTRHLSGRILKPSHGPTFTAAWTSSLAATRVSRSAQQASDSAPKTPDTSGRIYQPELLQCDQVAVSLKTSRDISRWGCPTLSKTWQDWVTERRGAYSARVKSARRISASGSSSWPTVRTSDCNNSPTSEQSGERYAQLRSAVSWPTATSRDWKGAYSKESHAKKNRMSLLPDAVAHWPTPATADGGKIGNQPNFGQVCLSNHPAIVGVPSRDKLEKSRKHGQAAPESSNSGGSRQGLSWPTPSGAVVNDGETLESWEARKQRNLEKHCNGNGMGTPLTIAVKQWGTPAANDHKSGRGNNERDY